MLLLTFACLPFKRFYEVSRQQEMHTGWKVGSIPDVYHRLLLCALELMLLFLSGLSMCSIYCGVRNVLNCLDFKHCLKWNITVCSSPFWILYHWNTANRAMLNVLRRLRSSFLILHLAELICNPFRVWPTLGDDRTRIVANLHAALFEIFRISPWLSTFIFLTSLHRF